MATHKNSGPKTERLNKLMSNFGKRLRAAREKKFDSAEKFAHALSMNPPAYRKYERGQSQPDFEVLTRICQVLDITPNDLLPDAAQPAKRPTTHPRKAGSQSEAA